MNKPMRKENRAYLTIERGGKTEEVKLATEGFNTLELIGLLETLKQRYISESPWDGPALKTEE